MPRRTERLADHQPAFALIARALLGDGMCVRFRAGGRSMTPTIEDGECLIVAPAAAASLGLADIAFCQTLSGPKAHRVVSVATGREGARLLITCGDAALERDGPISPEDVTGIVVAVDRTDQRVDLTVKGGARRLALLAVIELRRAFRRLKARTWLDLSPAARAASQ